jgi:hypothetical protein
MFFTAVQGKTYPFLKQMLSMMRFVGFLIATSHCIHQSGIFAIIFSLPDSISGGIFIAPQISKRVIISVSKRVIANTLPKGRGRKS